MEAAVITEAEVVLEEVEVEAVVVAVEVAAAEDAEEVEEQ